MNVFEETREDIYLSSDMMDEIVFEEIDNVDMLILEESNHDIKEIEQDMVHIASIWEQLADYIHIQGKEIDQANTQIENTEENTTNAVDNLEKASEYAKDKFIIARDVAIIIGGGVVGTGGFLAGPLIGVGTIAAGISAGIATVKGLHVYKKKPDPETLQ